MKSELILQLWNFHLSSIRPSFDRLTSENRRKRLTAETTSYGFNALHTAEAMVMMSRFILGVESNVPYSTYRASDEGRDIDPQQVRQLFEEGAEAIANAIRQTPDEAWDEPVQPPWLLTAYQTTSACWPLYTESGRSATPLAKSCCYHA